MFRSRILARAALAALAVSLLSCSQDNGTEPVATKELDSPSLLGSTTGSPNYIHAFANSGLYPYVCTYHTTAHYREGGMVIVNGQGADSAFVRIFEGAFDPDTSRVKPGAPVRWQNFDEGTHHTVTSE
jgi:plastocyanin